MVAILPLRHCQLFRSMAERAMNLLSTGMSLGSISSLDVDRFMYCSRCELWDSDTYPREQVHSVYLKIRDEIASGFEQFENTDWYRRDPEIIADRKRSRWARWRENHREQEKQRMRDYRAKLKATATKEKTVP
jgi:hypothetical protein